MASPWRAHGPWSHLRKRTETPWESTDVSVEKYDYTRLSMTTIWLLYMATMHGYMVITDITDIISLISLISLLSLLSLLALLSLCAVLIEMGKTGIFHRMNHERVQKIDWCKKNKLLTK